LAKSLNIMSDIYEIRIHARAGQGAKSAAHFVAEAGFAMNKYVQAFPSYGPERMGAPMNAFVRLSDRPIRIHSDVVEADVVIVIDPTLLACPEVTRGLRPGGYLVINSPDSATDLLQKLDISQRVISVDASGIAQEIFGKDLPNTAVLAVANQAAGFVDQEILEKVVRDFFTKKYNSEIGEKNILAMRRAAEGF